MPALYFCPECDNADERPQHWSCLLGTRNWCEHHVREQETIHSKNSWLESPRVAENPPERGKMWHLAHASVTKLERGFHNLMLLETQWVEMASMDRALECLREKVSFSNPQVVICCRDKFSTQKRTTKHSSALTVTMTGIEQLQSAQ